MESMLASAPLREHETHCSMSDQHTNYSSCGRWAGVKEEQRCPPSPPPKCRGPNRSARDGGSAEQQVPATCQLLPDQNGCEVQ